MTILGGRRRWATSVAFVVALAGSAFAQTPKGPEFTVNTTTNGDQRRPAVAVNDQGDFLVVWQDRSGLDGDSDGVAGQMYDASGTPIAGEFLVNSTTSGDQSYPSVAADGSGGFVVVWTGPQGYYGNTIVGRRVSSAGQPVGGEFSISSGTTAYQSNPGVAAAGSNFVVVWEGFTPANGETVDEIFGRRFNANGPVGGDFQVNSTTTYTQYAPRVAMDPIGNFVVVWDDPSFGDGQGAILGQRFNLFGAPVGTEFVQTGDGERRPDVAITRPGEFVVVWESGYDDDDTFFRRFGLLGALGPVTSVNNGGFPRVASDAAGNFVIVSAESVISDTIIGNAFDGLGNPIGGQFEVSAADAQYYGLDIDMRKATGEFVVAWSTDPSGVEDGDVFARQFGLDVTPTPTATSTPVVPPTVTPTATSSPVGPTVTPSRTPTSGPVPPTVTPVGPTVTPVGPTVTPGGPTLTPGGPTVTPGPATPDVEACDAVNDVAESGEQKESGRFCLSNPSSEPIFVVCTDVDFEEPELFVAGFVHGSSGSFEARAKAVPGRPSEFCFDPPLQVDPGAGAEFDLTVTVSPRATSSAAFRRVAHASLLPGRLPLGLETLALLSLVAMTAPTRRAAAARIVLAIVVLGIAALGGCSDDDDDGVPIRGVSTQRLVEIQSTGPIGPVSFTGLPITLSTLEVR